MKRANPPKVTSQVKILADALDLAYEPVSAAKTPQIASNEQQEAFWRAVKRFVEAICRRKLGTLDDDVVQEALIDIWQGLDGFQEKAKLSTWAYQIAQRRAQDKLRGTTRGTFATIDEAEGIEAPEGIDALNIEDKAILIAEAIKKLDAEKQAVVTLRLTHCSFTEIGKQLGIPTELARQRWSRALEEIKHESNR